MAPYTPTTWVDEQPASTPVKYRVNDDTAGEIAASATIEVVTEITPGTNLNADNMNHLETGVETAQDTAEDAATAAAAAQSTADAAIPKSLVTAIGQLIYSTASGVLAALVKPTVTAILQMTSAGSPSWRAIKGTIHLQLVDIEVDVDTLTGVGYFYIPSTMSGYNLVRANAFVFTAGTTGSTTVQVRNMTKHPSNDALSSAISIASGATVGSAGTVNTSYDGVSTNDRIKIYVTAQSTVKPKGLFVVLEYQLP